MDIKNFTFQHKHIIYVIASLAIILIGARYYNKTSDKKELSNTDITIERGDEKKEKNKEGQINSDVNSVIYVHIFGEVNKPGLLKLEGENRVIDAIEAADGATEEADLDSVNLAKILKDEDKIYVAPKSAKNNTNSSSNNLDVKKIDINTADQKELEEIPGVGEKTAQKIIEFRQKSLFNNIEDIKKIEGIGNKKFESLKDYITCN